MFKRLLESLGLRKQPPDIVSENHAGRCSASGGSDRADPPDDEQ